MASIVDVTRTDGTTERDAEAGWAGWAGWLALSADARASANGRMRAGARVPLVSFSFSISTMCECECECVCPVSGVRCPAVPVLSSLSACRLACLPVCVSSKRRSDSMIAIACFAFACVADGHLCPRWGWAELRCAGEVGAGRAGSWN